MRTGQGTFLANSFRLGLTCGVGCVTEPYLTGHARPEVFVYYMLNGFNFAEASYLSQPVFKWQGIHIGDPLYNPNKSKTPTLDTTAPPIPSVTVSWLNDSIILDIAINTEDREPELIKTQILYHSHNIKANTDTIDYERVFQMRRKVAIKGFDIGDTIDIALKAKDPVGNITSTPTYTWLVGEEGVLDVDELAITDDHNLVIQARPNPFSHSCRLECSNPNITQRITEIEIFDLNGNRVARLSNAPYTWQPSHEVHVGVYIVKIAIENKTSNRRIIYLGDTQQN